MLKSRGSNPASATNLLQNISHPLSQGFSMAKPKVKIKIKIKKSPQASMPPEAPAGPPVPSDGTGPMGAGYKRGGKTKAKTACKRGGKC
jgi:hypothetical protein